MNGLTALVRDLQLQLLGIVPKDVARRASEDEVRGELVPKVEDVLRLVARTRVQYLRVRVRCARQRRKLGEEGKLERRAGVHGWHRRKKQRCAGEDARTRRTAFRGNAFL